MIHTNWPSDGHRTGLKNRASLPFVTNGSWIDGNGDAGIRACLAEEFSSIYVLNLRGNQRTQGEQSRREGGKVFGSGSRAPVAITILVKNPNVAHDGCHIHYRDIGDYLSREEKLTTLREAQSISIARNTVDLRGSDWQTISPDKHHDWIGQRSDAFTQFYPLGSEGPQRRVRQTMRYLGCIHKDWGQIETHISITSHAMSVQKTHYK